MKDNLKPDIEGATNEMARRNLNFFIEKTMPSYESQWFHNVICRNIEDWFSGKGKDKLMVFLPPQHGKSQISTRHAPAWILGKEPNCKVGVAAYNSTVASKFNRDVQRIMDEDEYKQIFDTRLPSPMDANLSRNNHEFDLVKSRGSLVSVGVGGGLTSRQIDVMIIDDVYKDAKEAWSPVQRDNVMEWYRTVVETRLNNGSKVLIVFTRWHEEDLAGKLLEEQPKQWDVVKIPAIKVNDLDPNDPREIGEALWPDKHSIKKLRDIERRDTTTFENLFQQDPQPTKGLLYGPNFKTWSQADLKGEESFKGISEMYCDVADGGGDYLCAVFYDKTPDLIYITDIVYTKEGTEFSEQILAEAILRNKTQTAYFESNAGGKIYSRNVNKIYKSIKGNLARFIAFYQSKNKESRIFTNSATVVNKLVMPSNWAVKHPIFYHDVTRFEKEFKKNKNDDGPDALTGVVEKALSESGNYYYGSG